MTTVHRRRLTGSLLRPRKSESISHLRGEAVVNRPSTTISVKRCAHRRMIADVLDPDGQKSGTVRCLECSAIFLDPAPLRT